jgi:hypothetical protein
MYFPNRVQHEALNRRFSGTERTRTVTMKTSIRLRFTFFEYVALILLAYFCAYAFVPSVRDWTKTYLFRFFN